jgi:filamentous hemagglutinin
MLTDADYLRYARQLGLSTTNEPYRDIINSWLGIGGFTSFTNVSVGNGAGIMSFNQKTGTGNITSSSGDHIHTVTVNGSGSGASILTISSDLRIAVDLAATALGSMSGLGKTTWSILSDYSIDLTKNSPVSVTGQTMANNGSFSFTIFDPTPVTFTDPFAAVRATSNPQERLLILAQAMGWTLRDGMTWEDVYYLNMSPLMDGSIIGMSGGGYSHLEMDFWYPLPEHQRLFFIGFEAGRTASDFYMTYSAASAMQQIPINSSIRSLGDVQANLPHVGVAQSRINISNSGWTHVVDRHFSLRNASQFTISQNDLRGLLRNRDVVGSPITRTLNSNDGIRFVREIDVGRNIGLDKFNNMQPTSVMTILTDRQGNLVTAHPGVIR